MSLTTQDLKKVGELIDKKLGSGLAEQTSKFDAKLSEQTSKFDAKLDKQSINFGRKIDSALDKMELKFEAKLIEFKSEFFDKIDPILKEITTARDERPLIIGRVENLEEIHQEGKHSLPVTQ